MKISREKLASQAEATGFRPDILEKVAHLLGSHGILHMGNLDQDRLRIAFVVYGAMNRKDWRTVSVKITASVFPCTELS
ncbi:hypothetical protein JWG42_15780 [Desulfoprunum benzoelyticum]|uniref:Uncharacterized protein n=1 Tax=Desulfoprunum benzoelyticum TaxID=1506996 RepID=A0A840UTW2_9BACT|nr:hypothetical protein [Desulfoprunum benzoelyticum]MBB5349637.1 hypothetical protein [Desulfoprunum benzoelyticum]MBM9531618.1 hypothetical protein [Desulfoprunum benzoelyticum]